MSQQNRRTQGLRWWLQLSIMGLIVIELCWVVPWYRLLLQISTVATPLQASIVLGGMMLSAYLLGRVLETGRIIRSLQILSQFGLLILGLLFGSQVLLNRQMITTVNGLLVLDPGAVLVTFSLLWMWWRGASLGQSTIRPIIAWRRFELGLIMLIAYQLIIFRQGISGAGIYLFIVFLFISLLTVILTRITYIGFTQKITGNPFDRKWFLTIAIILGFVIGFATILGGVLTGQFSLLLDWLEISIKYAVAVFIFIVSLPGLLLSNLLGPLIPWLRQFISGITGQSGVDGESLSPSPLPTPMVEPLSIPGVIQAWLFWLVLIGIVIIIVIRARRKSSSSRKFVDEQPESLLKRGEVKLLIRKGFNDFASSMTGRLKPVRRVLELARIRRIYIQLLELCEELGHPRKDGQTPIEFLPDLGEIFPDFILELTQITQAYILVRYGELPEQPISMSEIEASWEKVVSEGRRLKRTGYTKLKTVDVKDVERVGI